MLKAHPLIGVGHDQFVRHHHLTAHNSFLLAAAENGLVGMLMWTAAVYFSFKGPVLVLRKVKEPEAEPARIWALALVTSLTALVVGTQFLTFNYHFVLWIYFGMSGALWHAVKRHRPDFDVAFGWRDPALIGAASAAVLTGIFISTRSG